MPALDVQCVLYYVKWPDTLMVLYIFGHLSASRCYWKRYWNSARGDNHLPVLRDLRQRASRWWRSWHSSVLDTPLHHTISLWNLQLYMPYALGYWQSISRSCWLYVSRNHEHIHSNARNLNADIDWSSQTSIDTVSSVVACSETSEIPEHFAVATTDLCWI